MEKTAFEAMERYMLAQMKDSAHDKYHIYRVLYAALDIAETEADVDMDVLLAACLLHDVGREAQAKDLALCHAQIGGDMAYSYLRQTGWPPDKALHVKNCIRAHRYRRNNEPESIEAKILFDADKLDVTGALGVARALQYGGQISEPLYILDAKNELVVEASDAERTSFFQEYSYKLGHVLDRLYTKRAKEISRIREKAMTDFYRHLFSEIQGLHKNGAERLGALLTKELSME